MLVTQTQPLGSRTCIGVEAGENNTGASNTFIGVKTGEQTGAGDSNTAIGTEAGRYITTVQEMLWLVWSQGNGIKQEMIIFL